MASIMKSGAQALCLAAACFALLPGSVAARTRDVPEIELKTSSQVLLPDMLLFDAAWKRSGFERKPDMIVVSRGKEVTVFGCLKGEDPMVSVNRAEIKVGYPADMKRVARIFCDATNNEIAAVGPERWESMSLEDRANYFGFRRVALRNEVDASHFYKNISTVVFDHVDLGAILRGTKGDGTLVAMTKHTPWDGNDRPWVTFCQTDGEIDIFSLQSWEYMPHQWIEENHHTFTLASSVMYETLREGCIDRRLKEENDKEYMEELSNIGLED